MEKGLLPVRQKALVLQIRWYQAQHRWLRRRNRDIQQGQQ